MIVDQAPLEILLLHPGGLSFHGDDPVDLALGGSETAVVSMARALSRLGHRVTVSCRTGEPRACGGVTYLPAERLAAARAGRECDVLLGVRFFDVLLKPPAARSYGLWHHDMPSPEIAQRMAPALARTTFCLFPSRYQLEAYETYFPGLGRHSLVTRNGVDFDALDNVRDNARRDGDRPRFLYASRPERGLAVLLWDIWPVLKRKLPDAELLVTSYSCQELPQSRRAREHEQLCDQLIRSTAGARKIGPLTRRQLWSHFATATAVLYPTNFSESSCMVALEAQAMGIPIVTTGRFALTETVGFCETLVSEPWRSPAYSRAFVETAVRLVEEPEFARRAQQAGQSHVTRESHSWDAIAGSWQSFFQRLFRERREKKKAGILRRLLRDSDVEAARRLVALEPDPKAIFHRLDLADLEARRRAKPSELEAQPVWVDFPADCLPPQLAETFSALSEALEKPRQQGEPVTVLDVGCFCANLSLLFAKDRPWVRLTGVDGNREAIATATGKARELGMEDRARFLCLVDPHRAGEVAELAPGCYDAVLLCEVLDYFPDPADLLAWAESRAHGWVVGYSLHGPWEAQSGERFRLWHLGEPELAQLLGGKQSLELRYFRCGETRRGEPLGGWIFRYRVDPGNVSGRLDVDRKLSRAAPLPRISVTILVKNEEANIRRAVESLEPIADQIVIGDTGCTDSTLGILRSMGIPAPDGEPAWGGAGRNVVEVRFEDFAQARNALACHADGDYILWHDADEIMIDAQVLRSLVDYNEYFDGFGIEQRHVVLDAQINSDFPLRCFRPRTVDGPLRWYGCIHEQVEHDFNSPPRRIVICPDVYVAHLGYLDIQLRTRKLFDRNWGLFLKDRQQNHGRLAGYVLGVREYFLLASWEIKLAGRMTQRAYRCLNYGFEVWYHHVRHLPPPFRRVAFPISRQILALLAAHKRPLRLTGTVPVQADFSLMVLPGDQPAATEHRAPSWTFFADLAELRAEVERRLEETGKQLAEALEIDSISVPLDLDCAPELRPWSLPPELFGLDPLA